jgi:hypothetical protein
VACRSRILWERGNQLAEARCSAGQGANRASSIGERPVEGGMRLARVHHNDDERGARLYLLDY